MSKNQVFCFLFLLIFYVIVVTNEFYGVTNVIFDWENNRVYIETLKQNYILFYNPRGLAYMALGLYLFLTLLELVPILLNKYRSQIIELIDRYVIYFLVYAPLGFSTLIAYFLGQCAGKFFDIEGTYDEFFVVLQAIRSLDNLTCLLYGSLLFLGVSIIVAVIYELSVVLSLFIYKQYLRWSLSRRK